MPPQGESALAKGLGIHDQHATSNTLPRDGALASEFSMPATNAARGAADPEAHAWPAAHNRHLPCEHAANNAPKGNRPHVRRSPRRSPISAPNTPLAIAKTRKSGEAARFRQNPLHSSAPKALRSDFFVKFLNQHANRSIFATKLCPARRKDPLPGMKSRGFRAILPIIPCFGPRRSRLTPNRPRPMPKTAPPHPGGPGRTHLPLA